MIELKDRVQAVPKRFKIYADDKKRKAGKLQSQQSQESQES